MEIETRIFCKRSGDACTYEFVILPVADSDRKRVIQLTSFAGFRE